MRQNETNCQNTQRSYVESQPIISKKNVGNVGNVDQGTVHSTRQQKKGC